MTLTAYDKKLFIYQRAWNEALGPNKTKNKTYLVSVLENLRDSSLKSGSVQSGLFKAEFQYFRSMRSGKFLVSFIKIWSVNWKMR
jgi:hypothetical protein